MEKRCVFKSVTFVYKFLKLAFLDILLPFSTKKKACTILVAVRMLVVSWLFQSFDHQFTSPVNNLATALYLMLLPFGMLCLMIYGQPHLWPRSEEGSKHTSTTKHTLQSLTQYIQLSSVVHDPCNVPEHGY